MGVGAYIVIIVSEVSRHKAYINGFTEPLNLCIFKVLL